MKKKLLKKIQQFLIKIFEICDDEIFQIKIDLKFLYINITKMNNCQKNKFDWNHYYDLINKKYKGNFQCLILNEKNRWITNTYIKNILMEYLNLDYTPNNLTIYKIAMTHTSYLNKDFNDIKNFKSIFTNIDVINGQEIEPIKSINEVIQLQEISYERLEFVGDAILRLIISDYLFSRYPEMHPGNLSDLRAQIENKKSFSEICSKISLHKYVLLSRAYEINSSRDKNIKLQCDLFEAFIGALYYDISDISYFDIGNKLDLIKTDKSYAYKICYELVVKLIEKELDLTIHLEHNNNYKNMLLNHYHKLKWDAPKYKVIDIINDENNKKKYKCGVLDNEKNIIGVGISFSKLSSEQMSAKNALYQLKVIKQYDNDDIPEEIFDKSIVYE